MRSPNDVPFVGFESRLNKLSIYNDNLHEEVHLLHNQFYPILPHDDDKMGSGVIMAEDDDDIEIN
jgi:hypothetical protein